MSWYRTRKLAWLERCGLCNHEEWPLFGVEKVIMASGQVWVRLTSLPSLQGHPDGLRRLLGEIRRLEHHCESEGIVGWVQAIRKGNLAMRSKVEMIGATCYAETDDHWHMHKVANYAGLPRTVREGVLAYGGRHHGHV